MITALLLATLAANPATLPSVLLAAEPGDTVRLATGKYGRVVIKNRSWSKPVIIEAGDARLTIVITNSNNITIRRGTFGPAKDTLGYAARVTRSTGISFYASSFIGSKRGIVIGGSQDISVNLAIIRGMTIDGIDVALSQRVKITNTLCENFRTGLAHPDCIQLWSRPDGITSDVTLISNTSNGKMQGFTAFNHIRDGVDDGGFDRITIKDNLVESTYAQGVALYDCRNCTVTGNITRRLRGATHRVSVNVRNCTACRVENNSVGS